MDPNGEDIIFVDENTGEVSILTIPFGKDILLCQHGKKLESESLSGSGVFRKSMHLYRTDGTLLSGMSKSDAKKLFNFMADNTNVEWGYMETSNDDGTSSFMVGSAHSNETESLVYGEAMSAKEGSVVRYDHNHLRTDTESTSGWPSTPNNAANGKYVDTDAWSDLMQRNPNVSLGIRHRTLPLIYSIGKLCVDSTHLHVWNRIKNKELTLQLYYTNKYYIIPFAYIGKNHWYVFVRNRSRKKYNVGWWDCNRLSYCSILDLYGRKGAFH